VCVGVCVCVSTGIDCQKYWVGKPKYFGAKGGKSEKCMGISQLFGGHVPGLPPSKSTPMCVSGYVYVWVSYWLCLHACVYLVAVYSSAL